MMLLTSLVLALSGFSYSDGKGEINIHSNDGRGTIVENGWQLELKGAVSINSKKEQFTLTAPVVTANVKSGKGAKSPNQIDYAKASNGVKVVQTARNQSATMRCNVAIYRAMGDRGKIDATGKVWLQTLNEGKRQLITATGSSGTAILNKTSQHGLDSATLTGAVKVEILQEGSKPTWLVFVCDKLTMTPKVITLSGRVRMTEEGNGRFGQLGEVDTLNAKLNDKGEMTGFDFKTKGAR